MAVKTITVDMDAYRLLAGEKRRGESFSMVIKRRLRSERTARALLERLPALALAEDALDEVSKLVAQRTRHLAESPVLDGGD